MKNWIISVIMSVSCLLYLSCGGNSGNMKEGKQIVKKQKMAENGVMSIHIYLYDDFPASKADYLKRELMKVYPSVILETAPIKLPRNYYYAPRNRYNGRGLLRDLDQYRHETVVLGLTNEVIYEPNEKSPTFGIFGISPIGSHVAVISSTLPSGKKHSDDHLVKLMMHELGHSFGLNHCKDEHCFMVDAEHGNKFANTPTFCPQCKSFLNGKGWKLK